jgi:serine/threonine protein kinase/Flp pilus assembly protein TadD
VTAPAALERLRGALSHSYTIDRELGRGGMATVYLAQDTRHDRLVALKVLHPELAASLGPDRFLREIKTAARLNHPHILALHESGEADGFLYYVMPYVEGESLRERLDREQLLPVDEAIHHARAIASALDYAHRQQIVHRDIKPENIMLYEGEAMVMDFGIAKAVSSVGSETLTQTGMMVGTPAYVSPEQAAGEATLDGRSDQYSLACMLYEMLSGERPFTGATAQAIMAKRFTETPKPIRTVRSTVPENVERAIGKAMSTDVTERFRTTAMFGQALASTSLSTPTDTETMPQVVSSAKSIAVLPFSNMSTDPENEYFTDGIADEIINALSKIKTLRVASRTASFALKGKNEEIAEIGRKLKVSTFLEGSVRKIGNRIRITAQLVNVADGYHLWSERYDREMEDVFAIQDDISQSIVKALRVILSEDEKKAIDRSRTENVKAYEFYLRGRQFFEDRRKSLENARQMFKRASDLDPDYALAYAGIADCSSFLYMYHDARETNLRQAEAASLRALELEPELAEAHLSRAIALWLNKRTDFAEAEAEFEKAMRFDPKLFEAPYFYARACHSHGKYAEAVRLFERASQLRPEDYQTPSFLAQAYRGLGKHAEAKVAMQRGLKLTEERIELNPDDARAYNLAGAILAGMGERDKAFEYTQRAAEIDPDDTITLYNAACTYATLGRHEEAMETLEKALDKGYGHKEWIEHDPDWASLRDSPRFKAMLEAM